MINKLLPIDMKRWMKVAASTLFVLYSAAVLLAPITFFAGCTQYRASNVERGISRPRTVDQLLSNIKLAFDRGLLLEPAFYSDDNLMTVFNGTSVQWHSEIIPGMRGAVVTFNPSMFGIKKVSVSVWKGKGASRDEDINVQFAPSSGLTLGGVRKVFGGEDSMNLGTVRDDAAPDESNTANLLDSGIGYFKQTPLTRNVGFPVRVEIGFSAQVQEPLTPWQRWVRSVKAEPLPDEASVTSMFIEVRVE